MVTLSLSLIALQHQSLQWSESPLESLPSQNSQCVNSKAGTQPQAALSECLFAHMSMQCTRTAVSLSRLPMAFTFALNTLLFCFLCFLCFLSCLLEPETHEQEIGTTCVSRRLLPRWQVKGSKFRGQDQMWIGRRLSQGALATMADVTPPSIGL